jgi:hypothetical protein
VIVALDGVLELAIALFGSDCSIVGAKAGRFGVTCTSSAGSIVVALDVVLVSTIAASS